MRQFRSLSFLRLRSAVDTPTKSRRLHGHNPTRRHQHTRHRHLPTPFYSTRCRRLHTQHPRPLVSGYPLPRLWPTHSVHHLPLDQVGPPTPRKSLPRSSMTSSVRVLLLLPNDLRPLLSKVMHGCPTQYDQKFPIP